MDPFHGSTRGSDSVWVALVGLGKEGILVEEVTQMIVPDIAEEVGNADLGDARLSKRLVKIANILQKHPGESYPNVFEQCDADAFYRFARNESVEKYSIISSHIEKTKVRSMECNTVLVLHDSTNITHGEGDECRDFYELSNDLYGYVAHVGLCVDLETWMPLGISNIEYVDRDESKKMERQSQTKTECWKSTDKQILRWIRGVESARESIGGNIIHVMDREMDSYELLCKLIDSKERFAVRGCYNRNIYFENSKSKILNSEIQAPVFEKRKVNLSKRKDKSKNKKSNKTRRERTATLAISAFNADILRGQHISASSGLQEKININIVLVKEESPPPDQEPVNWIILTTESIENKLDVTRIVDIYRKRWMTEELFKALKTGCAFSDRQFESQKTSQAALEVTLPIAWRLLLLRYLDREASSGPATLFLSKEEIEIFAKIRNKPISHFKTVNDVFREIARSGGHLSHNGPPGWLVLGRGFHKLLDVLKIAHQLRASIPLKDVANA